jgi:hypothetical protein
MARIRSIHPGLFTDELFAGLSMAARVLLLGLWTEADDQGVFDWKPVTLKMRVMPVDNVDVPSLLLELEQSDVIRKFDQDARAFGAIRNFCKFQRPKTPKYRVLKSAELRNYVASQYPVTETTEAEVVAFPQKVEIAPQRKEEGGKREEEQENIQPAAKAARRSSDKFEDFWKDYPKRDGDNPRKPAEKKFNALVKTGVDPDVMIAGARKASADARARDIYGTKFVPQAIKWLNDQRFIDYAAASFSSSSEETNWDAICATYKKLGIWSKHAPGNGPDSPSCQCPRDILAKHGIPLVSSSSEDPLPAPALRSM